MFVGHYGPSLAAKAAKNSIPLWMLFIAVQLLDVFWSVFVLLAIERSASLPELRPPIHSTSITCLIPTA